ncbi:hypothetical protein HU675_0010685 [Bradyrhizobium septentrionale]|uniref:hypothetical protein n=1 Tax=Bradyrhizobium septentrionale TaxID=1404411 RepID=UPI0015967820|nr:hypothetical protein [Bradyrhizobium septentrionale]UGY27176.1 hypothetical protein HU675_0010685 [Bradyrhizobium septentrionale]
MRTLSKKNFSLLKNVTPARVSQWISEGKIGPDALVGEGRRARINVDLATEQLKSRLDVTQRMANGSATLDEMPAPAPSSSSSALDEQFKRERLEGLQRENRRRAAEETARAGQYVDAAAARAEIAKVGDRVLSAIEEALPALAAALGAKFGVLDGEVLLLILRTGFDAVRQRVASERPLL